MPGGGTSIGSNYVYSSKPDGLTLLATGGAVYLNDLLNASAARYELVKMPVIVDHTSAAEATMYFMKSGIIDKPEDLPKAKGIVFGHTMLSGNSLLFLLAKELLNIPTEKLVIAYSGSTDALRALLSGEINMSSGSVVTIEANLAPYIASREVMLVLQSGGLDEKGDVVRNPFAPPVPTPKELYEKFNGKPPSGMAWDAYKGVLAATNTFDKNLFLPPGTPDTVVRTYWDAEDKLVKDAQFRKIADSIIGKESTYRVGEALDKDFKRLFGIDPKIVDWIRGILNKYGITVD